MPEPCIVARRLFKRYKKKLAVDSFDVSIPRGCICGLVGPNGAGKTSLIRMLFGLIAPTDGELRVLGLDPLHESLELRQRIGYVPEVHHIYKWMKVTQVLQFAGSIYRRWDSDECARVVRLLDLPLDRKVRELSRGNLAKLSLAIALSHHPDLLILDEPTSGLDPLVRREFLDGIQHLLDGNGTRSIFFSTHILTDIERIADRVIVMNDGRIAADGTLDELSASYTKASFVFDHPPKTNGNGLAAHVPGALRVDRGLREWVAIFPAAEPLHLNELATALGARDCMIRPVTFDEVFVELLDPRAHGSNNNGEP